MPVYKDFTILCLDLIVQIVHQHVDMRMHLEEVRTRHTLSAADFTKTVASQSLHCSLCTKNDIESITSKTSFNLQTIIP